MLLRYTYLIVPILRRQFIHGLAIIYYQEVYLLEMNDSTGSDARRFDTRLRRKFSPADAQIYRYREFMDSCFYV
jgi:hypothetical protein